MRRRFCTFTLTLLAALVWASGAGTADLNASARAKADLIVSAVTTAGSIRAGGALTVRHSLRNRGRVRASRSTLGYYLAPAASSKPRRVRIALRRTPGLMPWRIVRRSVSLVLPRPLPRASYVVVVCADASRRIAEARETNNCSSSSRTRPVQRTAPPRPSLTEQPAKVTASSVARFAFSSPGAATYRCSLDDGAFVACGSPTRYEGLAEGAHHFTVRALSAAGRRSGQTAYPWEIDRTPPHAPWFITVPESPARTTSAYFEFASEPGATFTCSVDGAPFAHCASPVFLAGPLGDGQHTLAVKSRDALGNQTPATARAWTVDTQAPPAPRLVGHPDNPTNLRRATFSFLGEPEPGVTWLCRLDGGSTAQCARPQHYPGPLAEGTHSFAAVARDLAGNESRTTFTWELGLGFDLGVFSGSNPAGVTAFGDWLHRPIRRVLEYFTFQTWAEIENPAQISTWQGRGYQMVYSVPMLPQSGATLAQGATGLYNVHFRRLAERLVATGQRSVVIRLGWEFNGFWYPWTAMNDPNSFILYWRQIVNTMRATPGANFTFDWCTVFGPASIDADRAYPGDAYVDVIGTSAFDQDWYPGWEDPITRWRNFITLPFGLQWQRDFARAHGKRIAFDEWALTIRTDGDHGGGDNPYYIERMFDWLNAVDDLQDGRPRVAWGLYFESESSEAEHRLLSGRFPLGAERMRALFGNVD